ncbi:uncharacterized protein LOC100878111 [Megachile rotundata]|uniref:uncharacterized protein LOC100878111 n=1 Tax=Megachile rotundata TaxID=143995 RepID=UPI000614C324|nr:PREDICTED: G patch domain-containing protein 4 [Megachile rotundata]
MNDFAKSQLMKYGWTEGKGLGKHENGIAEALKTKLKLDKTGVGHKDKDWHNWWETAYNKAANSIKVDSQIDDVLISLQKENKSDLSEDSNKKQMKFQASLKYSNFRKTSTLLNGNLITENSTASKVEDAPSITNVSLTDEELFQICGGRTAHKGARHGLTLSGKLNRIAQQEKGLLNITAYRNTNIEKLETNNNKSESNEHEIDNNNDIVSLPIHSFTEELIVPTISKNDRRKAKKRINTLTRQLNNLCNVSDNNNEKDMHSTDNGVLKEGLKVEEKEKSKKCKRKKERRGSASGDFKSIQTEEIDTSFLFSKELAKKKKMKGKKKRKRNNDIQSNFNECIPDTRNDEELAGSKAKKLKKSQNSDSTLQLFTKDKFQTKLHCDRTSTHSNRVSDSSEYISDVYFKNKIDRLNAKIKKKKNSKFLKKQERKLCADLEAVHFGTEELTEKKKYVKQSRSNRECNHK